MRKPCVLHPEEQDEFYFREGCHILEHSNGDADPELSIARARVAPGVRTRAHALDGVTERYLIISGRGRVHLEGLPQTEVGSGDVVLIPPGISQSIENIGTEDLVFFALCTPRFRQELYQELEYDDGG